MKRKSQLSFDGLSPSNFKMFHGGVYSIGTRKVRRPISTKKAMHIVLRAECAKGYLSLRRPQNFRMTIARLRGFAAKFSVRVYKYSINSNHIHCVVKANSRESFQNFLRAFSGTVAKKVLESGAMVKKEPRKPGRFWDLLAFSRVVEWGRAFKTAMDYVFQNEQEAAGLIPYQPRRRGRGKAPP